MTAEEIKVHMKVARKVRRQLKASPVAARKFLIEAGILDKKGKLANPCKN
jgi:hypothetical protein